MARQLGFLLGVALMLLVGLAYAASKGKSAGVKGGTVFDSRYGFSFSVPKNWRIQTFDEPSVLRVLLIKKNYEVNREVKELGGTFTIPEIRFFAREDTLSPVGFLDMLKEAVLTHKSTDNIVKELDLILSGEYVEMHETQVAGMAAVQAIFKRNYIRELQAPPMDPKYRQYGGLIARNEYDVHEIYLLKRGGILYLIQCFAEREFYPQNRTEFANILGSLKFIGETNLGGSGGELRHTADTLEKGGF